MRDRLIAAAKQPGWQLVAGAALLALMFPATSTGSIAAMVLSCAAGVAVAQHWGKLPAWLRTPPDRIAGAVVVAIVVAAGVSTFWETLTVSPDWMMGDWGPQHAVLKRAMPSLPGTDVPTWNHEVGTGDAPFELYPKLAYLVTGHAAIALGLEDDLPLAMMIVAVAVHLAIAAGTTLLAMRLAPKPIALVVGLVAIVDGGAVAHGGTNGLFRWALLHSAMALVFVVAAAVAVLAALRRPRLAASIGVWLTTALACAAHPAGLIAAAAMMLGLVGVALLADDVPPRRALAALGHVVLGVALGAAVWMPLAARILDYGQHFPNALHSPQQMLEALAQNVSPTTWYAVIGYAGYFGIVAGLWSRRALAVFVSATAIVLYVGMCDAGYLALDLAPGRGVARLGTERLAQLARPFLMAAAAYGLALVLGTAVAAWRGASPRRRLIAAALCGLMAAPVVRVVPAMWHAASHRAYGETQWLAADRLGRDALTAWARERVGEMRPDAWGRAVFETDTHEHFHLTALTGLPTFHLGPQPDLLLRERIEDLSPSSLRRFDVRWAIALDKSPALGEPDSEIVLGGYHIREIAGWDGQFARIERGTGTVRTTRLDDHAVEIEVDAPGPVLVALGTGYYPRWRATHESGLAEHVYAVPATQLGTLHVVGAWVKPGRTRFTCDGPLPSDGDGRILAILAALAAIATIVVWLRPRWRIRVLRRAAAVKARIPAFAPHVARYGVPLLLVILVGRGCGEAGAPLRALQLGSGVRATASVATRTGDGPWRECTYERFPGTYSCRDGVTAYDAMASLLNDAVPSWGFNTPGIAVSSSLPDVEVRIRISANLDGTYWIATRGGGAQLTVSGEAPREIDRGIISYSGGDREIEILAHVATSWQLTFVRQDTLMPSRPYLAPPPNAPPAELR